MKIKQAKIYQARLPFGSDFVISRRGGMFSETIVLELITEDNLAGYGEGIPIEFATGETLAGTMGDIENYLLSDGFPREIGSAGDIWAYSESFAGDKAHNAAICALETALLDALGKRERKYALAYLPSDHCTPTIAYSGIVTLGDRARVLEISRLTKKFGINKIRIKLSADFERNRTAIATVAEVCGGEADLRIDPNGVWDSELAFKHLPLIEQYRIKIVEEPLPKNAPGFAEFAREAKKRGVRLMACESAPTLADVETIIREGHYDIINVKLCRSGGFHRALRMIERIRSGGLAFQIGCTLGESSILSAAGRILGLANNDAVYYDGSYDQFLFRENFAASVNFGPGGQAGPLKGSGLGVEIDRVKLAKLSLNIKKIDLL